MVEIISPTKQRYRGVTYYWCGRYFQRKGVRLHRVVYACEKGPIPEGFDVHHVDEDRRNNQPGNLECLPESDHGKHHGKDSGIRGFDALPAARAAAAEWHGSDVGREWHRRHYEQHCAAVLHQRTDMVCAQCSAPFAGLTGSKFCSNKCKSAARRDTGVDDIDVSCPVCAATFRRSKYATTKTCSTECGVVLANAARAARRASRAR